MTVRLSSIETNRTRAQHKRHQLHTQRKGRDQASRIDIPLNCSMIVISPLTRSVETFLIAAKRLSLDDV